MGVTKKMKKNEKGFTLVELIVVLVILTILAAIAIPTFNGYIKKAKEKTVAVEARTVLLAADTLIAEANETGTAHSGTDAEAITEADIAELAEVDENKITLMVSDGELNGLTYSSGGVIYSYNNLTKKMEIKG